MGFKHPSPQSFCKYFIIGLLETHLTSLEPAGNSPCYYQHDNIYQGKYYFHIWLFPKVLTILSKLRMTHFCNFQLIELSDFQGIDFFAVIYNIYSVSMCKHPLFIIYTSKVFLLFKLKRGKNPAGKNSVEKGCTETLLKMENHCKYCIVVRDL